MNLLTSFSQINILSTWFFHIVDKDAQNQPVLILRHLFDFGGLPIEEQPALLFLYIEGRIAQANVK